MFHGNGGNHGHRIPLAKIFYLRMRCNVFMMSYRGYGLSEGSPSEKGACFPSTTISGTSIHPLPFQACNLMLKLPSITSGNIPFSRKPQ